MKYILLTLSLFLSQTALSVSLTKEEANTLQDCQVLLEQISQSDCGKSALKFLKNAYIKIGLNMSQRSMTFENKETLDAAFEMTGEWSPAPILTLSLGDNYFEDSNFGYQLGFSYFSDIAFEQTITRGDNVETADLLTYSKMTVLSFSPSIFYSFGRDDDTPKSFFTTGLGLNAGYSSVKGSAHITDFEEDTLCYDTGSDYIEGTATPDDIMTDCEFSRYDSAGLAYGGSIYLAYEYHNWLTEISGDVFTQDIDGDYTFSTSSTSFSISRKFQF